MVSEFTAQDTIALIADGVIEIDAAQIVTDLGHIEIMAGMGISIEDELQESQSFERGVYSKKQFSESAYQTVAVRSVLDSGAGVRLHTDYGDLVLQATDITSTEGTSVSAANGSIQLLMSKETDHYSYTRVKENFFRIKVTERGHDIETGIPNTIVGGYAIEAFQELSIAYEGDPELSLDEQIDVLSSIEGLEWMADVRAELAVDAESWHAVATAYDEWDKTTRSLSPSFAAVIAIAVTIATQGAAGELAATLAGESAAAAAAIKAATISVATQTAITVGNGALNGDIGGYLEDAYLHSDDLWQGAVTAAITAGAIESLDTEFFRGLSEDFVNNTQGELSLSLAGQAVQATTHAVAEAGIKALIYGEDLDANLGELIFNSLIQNAVNQLGERMALDIASSGFSDAITAIAQASAACGVGVLSSVANSEDSTGGCLSAAGGSLIASIITNTSERSQLEQEQREIAEWLEENLAGGSSFDELRESNSVFGIETAFYINDFLENRQELLDLARRTSDISRLIASLGAFIVGGSASEIQIAGQSSITVSGVDQTLFNSEIRNATAIISFLQEERLIGTIFNTNFHISSVPEEYLPEILVGEDLRSVEYADFLISGGVLLFVSLLDEYEEVFRTRYIGGDTTDAPWEEGAVIFHTLRQMAFEQGVEKSLEHFENVIEYVGTVPDYFNQEDIEWLYNSLTRRYNETKGFFESMELVSFGTVSASVGSAGVEESFRLIRRTGGLISDATRLNAVDDLLKEISGLSDAQKALLREDLYLNDNLLRAFKEDLSYVDTWRLLDDAGTSLNANLLVLDKTRYLQSLGLTDGQIISIAHVDDFRAFQIAENLGIKNVPSSHFVPVVENAFLLADDIAPTIVDDLVELTNSRHLLNPDALNGHLRNIMDNLGNPGVSGLVYELEVLRGLVREGSDVLFSRQLLNRNGSPREVDIQIRSNGGEIIEVKSWSTGNPQTLGENIEDLGFQAGNLHSDVLSQFERYTGWARIESGAADIWYNASRSDLQALLKDIRGDTAVSSNLDFMTHLIIENNTGLHTFVRSEWR